MLALGSQCAGPMGGLGETGESGGRGEEGGRGGGRGRRPSVCVYFGRIIGMLGDSRGGLECRLKVGKGKCSVRLTWRWVGEAEDGGPPWVDNGWS